MVGADADPKRVESQRRQIVAWTKGTQPDPENARRLADALEVEPDYFMDIAPSAEQLRQLHEAADFLTGALGTLAELQETQRLLLDQQKQLAERLGRIESALDRRADANAGT